MIVENIQRGDGDSDADIAGSVRAYARSKLLEVFSTQVVLNRVCYTSVGCRIYVPHEAVAKATSATFWPSGIKCRPWRQRKNMRPAAQRENTTARQQHDKLRITLRPSRPAESVHSTSTVHSVHSTSLDQRPTETFRDGLSQGDWLDDEDWEDDIRRMEEDYVAQHALHDWWEGDRRENSGAGDYSAERY